MVVLLTWLFLFLFLLCHFLDFRSTLVSRTRSAAKSRLTRTETRHLASVVLGRARIRSWSLRSAGLSEEDWRRRRIDFKSRSRAYHRRQSLQILQRLWAGNLTMGMLSPSLQKALKVQLNFNKHQVVYRGPRGTQRSSLQLCCDMKRKTRIRTVDGTEEPFSSLGWDRLVPSVTLQDLAKCQYQNCAVVTSAGAVLNSSLGREIGKTTYWTRRGRDTKYITRS